MVGPSIFEKHIIVDAVISWMETAKKKFFKVDFKKAFDSINWCFIDSVLKQLGFCL